MAIHEPRRGVPVLGTTPKVHRGFYNAWTSKGLHTEILDHIQARLLLCTCKQRGLGSLLYPANAATPVCIFSVRFEPCQAAAALARRGEASRLA